MDYMFSRCNNLEKIYLSNKFDTSQVTDMRYMLSFCQKISSIDLSGFNTIRVINMTSMFSNCNNLENLDLSKFDTRECEDMSFKL